MSETQDAYETKEDGAYWGKLEIVGHETYYGRIRELDYGRVAIDIIPTGGEPGDELHTKTFGPNAIFSIEPVGRQACYTLSGQEDYSARPLTWKERAFLDEANLQP